MLLQRDPVRKRKNKRKIIREDPDGFKYDKTEMHDDQNPQEQTVKEYFCTLYSNEAMCVRG